jgi:hypothetical protein
MKTILQFIAIALILSACGMPVPPPSGGSAQGAQPAQSMVSEPAAAAESAPASSQPVGAESTSHPYQIVDSGQVARYDNNQLVARAVQGASFAGQDGN